MIQMDLKFITTLRCSRRCNGCYQQPLIQSRPTYQATIDDVKNFIKVSEESKYVWHSINLTGGEPTLWDHLEEACSLLHKHPNITKLFVITNGNNPDRTMALKDKVDGIFATIYPENKDNVNKIKEFYGKHCEVWDHTYFFITPDELVPVERRKRYGCMCSGPLYYDGQIYSCSMVPALTLKFGCKSVIVDEAIHPCKQGFMDGLNHKQDICWGCVSNRRIKRYLNHCISDNLLQIP